MFDYIYSYAPVTIKDYIDTLKNVAQRPDYHPEGNAYIHTKVVVKRIAKTGDINLILAAFLHDLGKVGVSKDVLHKQGELSVGEWDEMKAHPLIGVRKILRLNAPHKLRSRIILGPFEHHLNPDMSGYPRTIFMDKISLIGKILRIADVYEALTAQRAYRTRAFAPDEALRKMWSEGDRNLIRFY